MSEPVTVTIGGQSIDVPTALNFVGLKYIRPHLRAYGVDKDLVVMAEEAIEVVAAAIVVGRQAGSGKKPEEVVAEIKDEAISIQGRLLASECLGICAAVMPIMVAAGYWKMPPEGEAKPAGEPAA